MPMSNSRAIMVLLTVGALIALAQCVSSPTTTPAAAPRPPPPPRLSDAECLKDLRCWADRHAINASVRCTRAIAAELRFDHEWTDGTMNPRFPRMGWKDPAKGHITYFGDNLRVQNAFGAMQKAEYACVYDPATDTALQVAIAPK